MNATGNYLLLSLTDALKNFECFGQWQIIINNLDIYYYFVKFQCLIHFLLVNATWVLIKKDPILLHTWEDKLFIFTSANQYYDYTMMKGTPLSEFESWNNRKKLFYTLML